MAFVVIAALIATWLVPFLKQHVNNDVRLIMALAALACMSPLVSKPVRRKAWAWIAPRVRDIIRDTVQWGVWRDDEILGLDKDEETDSGAEPSDSG
jgi:hypothetical protein